MKSKGTSNGFRLSGRTRIRDCCPYRIRMKTRFTPIVWAVWLVLLSGTSVWSQSSSLYFNRNSFVSAGQAVPGIHQSLLPFFGPFTDDDSGWGQTLTVSNVTFTGRYLTLSSINSGPVLWNYDAGGPLRIHFANGARLFGADFSSSASDVTPSFTATLSLDNGETFQFPAPTSPGSTFFGFISATPIRDLIFNDGGLVGATHLHEERIGNIFMVMEIPEPSTVALFGLGGFLFAAHMLRRRTRSFPAFHWEVFRFALAHGAIANHLHGHARTRGRQSECAAARAGI